MIAAYPLPSLHAQDLARVLISSLPKVRWKQPERSVACHVTGGNYAREITVDSLLHWVSPNIQVNSAGLAAYVFFSLGKQ